MGQMRNSYKILIGKPNGSVHMRQMGVDSSYKNNV
jgi:hypothetical protein